MKKIKTTTLQYSETSLRLTLLYMLLKLYTVLRISVLFILVLTEIVFIFCFLFSRTVIVISHKARSKSSSKYVYVGVSSSFRSCQRWLRIYFFCIFLEFAGVEISFMFHYFFPLTENHCPR
jgi:small-conductance mechanosensitive channel